MLSAGDDRVWALDFETLTWSPEYPSSGDPFALSAAHFDQVNYPGAIFDPVDEDVTDIHPVSLHTYDHLTFITHGSGGEPINELFMIGASAYRGSASHSPYWPKHPAFTWTYSFSTKKWTWRDTSGVRTRSGSPNARGSSSEYDPLSGLVYTIEAEAKRIWTYDITTDSWMQLNGVKNHPDIGIEIGTAYAHRPDDAPAIFEFGGEYPTHNNLYRFVLGTKTWSVMPTGEVRPPVAGGYGLVYDSHNDVLLAHKDNGHIYAYRFDTQRWEKKSRGPVDGKTHRVHGNFVYDPVNNVAILAHKEGGLIETWAYRYKK